MSKGKEKGEMLAGFEKREGKDKLGDNLDIITNVHRLIGGSGESIGSVEEGGRNVKGGDGGMITQGE